MDLIIIFLAVMFILGMAGAWQSRNISEATEEDKEFCKYQSQSIPFADQVSPYDQCLQKRVTDRKRSSK